MKLVLSYQIFHNNTDLKHPRGTYRDDHTSPVCHI